MNFRCPYCGHSLGSQPLSRCPSCAKVMNIPKRFRPNGGRIPECVQKDLSPGRRPRQRNIGSEVILRAATWSHVTSSPRYVAVLVILFVVMGVSLTQQANRHNTESIHVFDPIQRATDDLVTLRTALEMFHADCGRYPSTRESLLALIRSPRIRGWNGPYIKMLIPDPWKNSYRYSMIQGVMRLASDGPDGITETPDDIHAPATITLPPAPDGLSLSLPFPSSTSGGAQAHTSLPGHTAP